MAAGSKRLIYFENWVDPAGPDLLAAQPDIDLVRLSYAADEASNWSQMSRAHGYQIAPRTELKEPWFGTAQLLERCPDLLAISSTGAGYDMVDVEACTAAGVIVCNQSGTNKEPVAEHALGFMIALSKKMQVAGNAMRRAAGVERFSYVGGNLVGKTVGIVGIGRIGTRTAELCRGLFGMTVIAFDPLLSASEVQARGALKVDLDQLLSSSDFISVHCPRNSQTLGMFGADAFRRMKATSYFINTARGGIHNEEALAAALEQGWIAGAGIDVFLDEPPAPDHPLLAFDNLIATPHIAGITVEALREMATAAADQWKSIFAGEMPPRPVNPEAWPAYARRFNRIFGFGPGDGNAKPDKKPGRSNGHG